MKIRFHLPGLRYNFPLNMILVGMMKQYPDFFYDNIEIGSFFGEFPTSRWGGGRFCNGDQCDSAFIKRVVKAYNDNGIPVRYTYTNPELNRFDCEDAYCNFCMDVANNGMNEVLVVNPVLEDYIRNKYPRFKINSSTCKEIKEINALNEELSKDYALVVLDYNLNNKWDFLSRIERKDKCELLINACCVPNCPRRGEHYKCIAQQQKIVLMNRKLPKDKQLPVPGWHCEYGDKNSIFKIKDYETYISPEAIFEKYVPLGFNNFKIEGRTGNLFNLIESYCLWLMKPEKRDEGRFMLITNLQATKVINVGQPRPGVWP
jgi:hypothetical protein